MLLIIPEVTVILPVDIEGAARVCVGVGAQHLVEMEDMDTGRAVAMAEAMRLLLKKFIQLNNLDSGNAVVVEVESYVEQYAPPSPGDGI